MSENSAYLHYLVYGKIIIDNIRLDDGHVATGVLGGGGPQAAFGARLWSDSVGFLSRSGTDIEDEFVANLEDLDVDLLGWARYPDLLTMRGNPIAYSQDEYLVDDAGQQAQIIFRRQNWLQLLSRPLDLPPSYRQPHAIHLVTEYHDEPMVRTARRLREQGAIFSLEPLIDFQEWTNRDQILSLLPDVDIVTPDWPSASSIAGSEDPEEVVRYWSRLGPELVAVRHGAQGSFVWDRHRDEVIHIPVFPVEVLDPTGAGNGYGGGLVVGWERERDALVAGTYAAISASFLVERLGVPRLTAALQAQAQRRLKEALPRARCL